ncbi:heparinase II/III domain-containing protein [Pseudalkalibacillus salsuginis]|uniref:heparinase II/III domain-containing protein n=1 Tax=Pseudalkalibacillus salsuginis TaxID=2910972 RepID=UPI001F32B211|nr:heparinase II/III family protein [Pseudalkalibacillus salsuginis]MCF6409981.1 heparinase II/III family protein [Pseudalkalibacillus salsuginis]
MIKNNKKQDVELTDINTLEVGEETRFSIYPSPEMVNAIVEDEDILKWEGNKLIAITQGETKVRIEVHLKEQKIQFVKNIKVLPPVKAIFSLKETSHPRLLFNKHELEKMKRYLNNEDFWLKDNWTKLENIADNFSNEESFVIKYATTPYELEIPLPITQLAYMGDPPGFDDYPYWTMYSRAIEKRIKILSIAYLMTQKSKYANIVKEYLLALSTFTRWYEFPYRNAEGNLSNAHFTLGAAVGFDSIYNTLSSSERLIISEAIRDKGLKPLAIDIGNFDPHNIIASKQVAMLVGSLTIADKVPFLNKYINSSYEYLKTYLDKRLTTTETEGLLYTNVAARHIILAADVLNRVTGEGSLIHHEYFKEQLPEQFIYFMGTGEKNSFANLSDSFYKLDLMYLMAVFASTNNYPVGYWYLQKYENENPELIIHLKNQGTAVSPDEFYKKNKSKVFSKIGWASLRSGWGKDDHFLGFTSSASNRGHNHFDQNNFVLNVGGDWLLINPGYQDYVPGPGNDFTTGTVGHNCMLIGEMGQTKRGGGKISAQFISATYSYVEGDATKSYDVYLDLWKRKVLFIDQAFYLIIDRVVGAEEHPLNFLFHTQSKLFQNGKEIKVGTDVSNDILTFKGETGQVDFKSFSPQETIITLEEYAGAEKYGPYVNINFPQYQPKRNLVTLLLPYRKEQLPKIDVYSVVFNKGFVKLDYLYEDEVGILYDALDDEYYMDRTQKTNDLEFKAKQFHIRFDKETEELQSFAVISGSEVIWKQRTLVASNHPISMTIVHEKTKMTCKLTLNEETKLSIFYPDKPLVTINGDLYETRYNFTDSCLNLSLKKGNYELEIEREF